MLDVDEPEDRSPLSATDLDEGTERVEDDQVFGKVADGADVFVEQPTESQLRSWLAGVVRRDEAALGGLYDALSGRVFRLALRITRSVPTAEEVVEDTFWQVWRQAPRYDPGRGSVLTWMLTITRSRALDALRRVDELVLDAEIGEQETEEADGPEALIVGGEVSSFLDKALARLEPLPRQLISLAFFRGLSHDEIAVRMGLPLGTVKSHIRRALLRLRELLPASANWGTP